MDFGDRCREREFGMTKTEDCRVLRELDAIAMREDKFIEEELRKEDCQQALKGVSDRLILTTAFEALPWRSGLLYTVGIISRHRKHSVINVHIADSGLSQNAAPLGGSINQTSRCWQQNKNRECIASGGGNDHTSWCW